MPLLEVYPGESLDKRILGSSSVGYNFLYQPNPKCIWPGAPLGQQGLELTKGRTETSLNMAAIKTFPEFVYSHILLSSACV